MRISTSYMYQHQIDSMSNAVGRYSDIMGRLSAGQTVLKPSDDPSGASAALNYENALSKLDQYSTARRYAEDALGQENNTLDSITDILTSGLTEKIVAGGNGAYSNEDRQALATELKGIRANLMDLANTRDSDGNYIFAGYKTGQAPFKEDGTYIGGNKAMSQFVADGTEMQVGDTGDQVFMSGTENDLFKAIDSAINQLNQDIETDDQRKSLQDTLDSVNKTVKKNIDNLGKIQARLGTNLQQIDSLGSISDEQEITEQSRLEESLGSDWNTMITLLSQSKMNELALNSSMMVFQSMQQISIFNVLG
ncbi:flagellar hook-associated protein FlgL [Enterobacter pasteurii]|uniref:flagellar hook-associated protein FlgL n=1 Tax=Enterobacter pasteurii TaxID=3029761 RepID=UPI0011DC7615|nr:flagellar hook-associated protein FlgL [Enterobacter pasteurii]QLA68107.1 flagellar hook-associated protein FlgL [Enterobacter pasteurii]